MKLSVRKAEYITSRYELSQRPPQTLAEVAFVGRSNVGKSSLLNALCQRRSLARVGKTPGVTKALNYYELELKSEAEEIRNFYLVDLPGYGYAQVSRGEGKRWGQVCEKYLLEDETLRAIILLVDSRREPKDEERWFAGLAEDIPIILALTKVDKLRSSERNKRQKEIIQELDWQPAACIQTSGVKGKPQGIDNLRGIIWNTLIDK